MTDETQATIAAWAEETFGPVAEPARLAERAMLEMEELREALSCGSKEDSAHEMADILILLYRAAEETDIDLHQAVNEKMAINRARKWRAAGDGTGSHIA